MKNGIMSKISDLDIEIFCLKNCKYRNYYDGWCHYYDKDTCEINEMECEYAIKKCRVD